MVDIIAIEGPECAGKSTLLETLKGSNLADDIVLCQEMPTRIGRSFPLGTSALYDTEMAFLSLNAVMFEQWSSLVQTERRVIADRCWISQIIYSKVRSQFLDHYDFDPEMFVRQERVLFQLYQDLIERTCVVFLQVSPEVSLSRLEVRVKKFKLNHAPDSKWTCLAYAEYGKYIGSTNERNKPAHRVIEAGGSTTDTYERFKEVCSELHFSL